MFDDSLLDSSVRRAPVLTGTHWLIAIAVAAAAFFAGYFLLPMLSANETSVIVTQSVILGFLFGAFALGLTYVLTDAKRNGFNRIVWSIIYIILPLAGFIIYLIYSAAKTGEWKRATLPIAYIFEALVIGGMILVPLIYTQTLPKAQLMTFLSAPPPPPPPPAAAAPAPRIVHRVSLEDIMRAPTVIPKTVTMVKEEPEPPPSAVGVVGGVPGGVPGGQMGGVLGGVLGGVMSSAPPPPPPPKPQVPQRVRVGGQVESAKLIFGPKPEYPPLAKMARIQGEVRLDALISKDGTIENLKVISGHPLLVASAMDAVKRWRYQPTLLNGEAVEVATEIDVNFTLAE